MNGPSDAVASGVAEEHRQQPLPHAVATLNAISAILGQHIELEKRLDLALTKTLSALDIGAGAILLFDDRSGDLMFKSQQGWRHQDPLVSDARIKIETGPFAEAMYRRQTILADDFSSNPPGTPLLFLEEDIQSLALIPIHAHNRLVGVLSVMSYQPRPFGHDDKEFLSAVAERVSLALDNARLHRRVQRLLQEQSALHEVAVAIQGVLSLETVMEQGLRALIALFELDTAAILFLDNQNRLIPVTFQGALPEHWLRLRMNPDHLRNTFFDRQPSKQRSQIIPDVTAPGKDASSGAYAGEMRTVARTSLFVRGRLIGIVEMAARRPNALTSQDLPLLESMGAQLAVAIEAARLHEQTQRRVEDLTTLTRASEALNRSLDLQNILTVVLDELSALVHHAADSPWAAIYLVDPNQSRLFLAASRGLADDTSSRERSSSPGAPMRVGDGISFESIMDSSEVIELPRAKDGASDGFFADQPLVAVPLNVDDNPIGVVLIAGRLPSSQARSLLSTLASMTAVAIDKAYLYQETRRRLDEASLLHEVALEAASELDFDAIISHTVQAVQRRLKYEYVSALLLDEGGEYLCTHSSFNNHHPSDVEVKLTVGEGVSGRVVQAGKSILVPDVALVENYVATVPGVRSELCVPLRIGERVIGVINAESSQVDAFTVDDERLMTTIAGQLAIAMENASLHDETRRRLREMTALFNFAHHLSTHVHTADLLRTICLSIREVLECRAVSIALLEPDTQMLEIRAEEGLRQEARETARLRVGEGIMGQVASTGQSLYVPDVHQVNGFIFFDRSFHSLLTVPLVFKNRVIGTLSVDHEEVDAFSADDERLVTIAAAQAAVAIENSRLFQDLQARASSLAQAYEELKEIERLKDELAQNVSHELRTPLSFIRGYVELLLGGDMGPLNVRQEQTLEIISEKTAAVSQLVNNIMLLQQLDHRPLQLGLTDLLQVAEEAVAKARSTAKEKGIALELSAPPELPLVLADPVRIALVFRNLLDNAMKFSPNGGLVQVKMEHDPERIQIAVCDEGIGIARDQLDRIFERFYQIDSSLKRRFEGTGLGLTIAKRIVEAHGGRIWVKSRLRKGSVFLFDIPKSTGDKVRDSTKADDENAKA